MEDDQDPRVREPEDTDAMSRLRRILRPSVSFLRCGRFKIEKEDWGDGMCFYEIPLRISLTFKRTTYVDEKMRNIFQIEFVLLYWKLRIAWY